MDRDKLIEEYIRNKAFELNQKYPFLLQEAKINGIIERCKRSSSSFEEIKKSIDQFIYEIDLYKNLGIYVERSKNNNLSSLAVLNMNNEKNGIYLSQQQIDLLMITELESKEELKKYVEEICGQFPNKKVEEVILGFDSLDLETCKRKLFNEYQNSLIDYISNTTMSPILKLRHKIEKFGISEEDMNAYSDYLVKAAKSGLSERMIIRNILNDISAKYGNEIVDKINHFMNDDFENIRGVSYDEIKSLSEFIDRDKSLDTIIIATGKYNNIMANTKDGYKFDPYLTDKSYRYCLKHNKHMRYHALFDYAHVENLINQYLCKEIFDYRKATLDDLEVLKSHKEEILSELKKYIDESFDYINRVNVQYSDGTWAINEIEVFNELVEKFNLDINKPYSMVWERYFGITIDDIMNLFKDIKKPLGVEFIYNETTLSECANKRRAVEKVLYDINRINPNFIDRFGDQMHLSDEDVLTESGRLNVSDTAMMLSRIKNGMVLYDGELRPIKPLVTECTEHDFHFTKSFLDNYKLYDSKNDLWDIKRGMQDVINEIYLNNGVNFDRVTYWSILGQVDHNLCRENRKLLLQGKSKGELVSDMYAGLVRTGETFDNYKSLNPNIKPHESFGM